MMGYAPTLTPSFCICGKVTNRHSQVCTVLRDEGQNMTPLLWDTDVYSAHTRLIHSDLMKSERKENKQRERICLHTESALGGGITDHFPKKTKSVRAVQSRFPFVMSRTRNQVKQRNQVSWDRKKYNASLYIDWGSEENRLRKV